MNADARNWLVAAALVVLGVVVVLLVNRWIKNLERNTEQACKEIDLLDQTATALIDDDRTPLAVAEFVGRLPMVSARPEFAEWVVNNKDTLAEPAPKDDFSAAVEGMVDEGKVLLAASLTLALSASASSHRFSADRLRKQLRDGLSEIFRKASADAPAAPAVPPAAAAPAAPAAAPPAPQAHAPGRYGIIGAAGTGKTSWIDAHGVAIGGADGVIVGGATVRMAAGNVTITVRTGNSGGETVVSASPRELMAAELYVRSDPKPHHSWERQREAAVA